jgi:hypothetical protein
MMLKRMNRFGKEEQPAIEAVARHFSGTWEQGEGSSGVYVRLAGKRIAVETTTIKPVPVNRAIAPTPRLRFDRVALALVKRLQLAFRGSAPDDKALILTVTAPIRLASKTAQELEKKIRARLARGTAGAELRHTIQGNRIRVRFVRLRSGRGVQVIGFLHNPDSNPDVLLNLAQSLLDCIAEASKRVASGVASGRWLVVVNDEGFSRVEAYRHVCSQLFLPAGFQTILMVFAGGRVETLTE